MKDQTTAENSDSLLRIMVLNAQDLFLFADKYDGTPVAEMNEIKWGLMSSSLFNNKSKDKCFSLAQTIMKSNADIIMMTEIGGKESLENFSRFTLEDKYQAHSLPSNSDRGIDLGYLTRKTLPFEFEIHSYKNYPLPHPARRFSRDVLRLDVKKNGSLKMILLLVHIKSKLDMRKEDYEGRTRRKIEVEGLVKIYQELNETNDVPILVGGDFNGLAHELATEEEFKPIYEKTNLKDIAALCTIPIEERFSYIYFDRYGNRFVQQLDYLFIDQKYESLIYKSECLFPRFFTGTGSALPIPTRYEQKNTLPSDHYPFLATLSI